jgi:hypothetical protein
MQKIVEGGAARRASLSPRAGHFLISRELWSRWWFPSSLPWPFRRGELYAMRKLVTASLPVPTSFPVPFYMSPRSILMMSRQKITKTCTILWPLHWSYCQSHIFYHAQSYHFIYGLFFYDVYMKIYRGFFTVVNG